MNAIHADYPSVERKSGTFKRLHKLRDACADCVWTCKAAEKPAESESECECEFIGFGLSFDTADQTESKQSNELKLECMRSHNVPDEGIIHRVSLLPFDD